MAIEIFGFLFKPEISIGDIAAIAALISSALIFWFGYSRTRKSEQIKIAREQMDRLDNKFEEFDLRFVNVEELMEKVLKEGIQSEETFNSIQTYLGAINHIAYEIDYFEYLVTSHEITDRKVIQYYAIRVREILNNLIRGLEYFNPPVGSGNLIQPHIRHRAKEEEDRLLIFRNKWTERAWPENSSRY